MHTTDLSPPPPRPRGTPAPRLPAAIPRGAPFRLNLTPTHDLLVLSQRPDLTGGYGERLVVRAGADV
jgi:hypothetical protein